MSKLNKDIIISEDEVNLTLYEIFKNRKDINFITIETCNIVTGSLNKNS